jgi:hypothetical protein
MTLLLNLLLKLLLGKNGNTVVCVCSKSLPRIARVAREQRGAAENNNLRGAAADSVVWPRTARRDYDDCGVVGREERGVASTKAPCRSSESAVQPRRECCVA